MRRVRFLRNLFVAAAAVELMPTDAPAETNSVVAELDSAWSTWMQPVGPTGKRSQGENWRRQNPKEWAALLAYRNGTGPRPNLVTNTGRQMVYETAAWYAAKASVPPPAVPQAPVIPEELAGQNIMFVTGDLEPVGNTLYAHDTFLVLAE